MTRRAKTGSCIDWSNARRPRLQPVMTTGLVPTPHTMAGKTTREMTAPERRVEKRIKDVVKTLMRIGATNEAEARKQAEQRVWATFGWEPGFHGWRESI